MEFATVRIDKMIGYLCILGCIIFTVYGQMIIKWRIAQKGVMPVQLAGQIMFLFNSFLDPFVISGFASAFIASLFWMAALSKFDLSHAYPFMSLSFIIVLLSSIIIFGEAFTLGKVLGALLICAGIIVTVKVK